MQDLEVSMVYHEIADDAKKLLALKEHCGKHIKRLIRTIPDPPVLMDDDNHVIVETNYVKMKRKLNLQLGLKTNVSVYVYFCIRKRRDG